MQGSRLYVGNLSYSVTSEQLKELFTKYGEVVKADIIQGKGFGFIEMSTSDAAEKAQKELNETEFEGRKLRIDEARPRPVRTDYNSPRGGGFGPSRGGYSPGGRGSYGSRRGGQRRNNRRERGSRDRGY